MPRTAPYSMPEEALHGFLCRAFDGSALRRLAEFGPHGELLAADLPSPPVALSELAHGLIVGMGRRGLLDERFFGRLLLQRPELHREIKEIMRMFGCQVGALDPPELVDISPRPQQPWLSLSLRLGRLSLLITLGVVGGTLAVVVWNGLASMDDDPLGGDVVVKLHTCARGEPCVSCSCERPLDCNPEGLCVEPPSTVEADVPSAPDVCADPRMERLLTALVRCEHNGSIHACERGISLNAFSTAGELDDVLARLPGSVSLHFPAGKPSLESGRPWPDARIRAHYLRMLDGSLANLRNAEAIVLIARSSKSGSPQRNFLYAVARAEFAAGLIGEAVGSTPLEREAVDSKLRSFVTGSGRVMDVKAFNNAYSGRFITWSAESEVALHRSLEPGAAPADAQWADNVINQSIVVVPIPCPIPSKVTTSG